MSEITTEIATIDVTTNDVIAGFKNPGSSVFSTVQAITFADKLSIIKAMTNAENLRDNLNKSLAIVNWTAQDVALTDEKSGDVTDATRLVLMTADGKAYACVSDGIAKSLQVILAVAGHPSTWDEPIKVKALEEQGKGMNRYLTLTLA